MVKACLVIHHSPMIGYANNFDFARSESCIGVWQSYADQPKDRMHIGAPVSTLMRDGDIRSDMCSWSIDNAIPWIIGHLHDRGKIFPMQEIGLLRFTILSAIVTWLLWAAPSIRVIISISFALIFGDIAWISYFNTLYNETSVLAGAFIAIWSLVGLVAGDRKCFPLSFVGVATLGLSKVQYAPLAVMLAIVALLLLRDIRGIILLGASLIFFGAYSIASGPDIGLRHSTKIANNTDTYLGAVLPAAKDRVSATRQLGLPKSCIPSIGLNFYTPGVAEKHPCPDVINISRVKLIPLFILQPTTFFVPMWEILKRAKPVYLSYMGRIESPIMKNSRIYKGVVLTSASTYIDKLPTTAFASLVVLSIAAGLLVLVRNHGILAIASAICSLVALYAAGSSVFGDGYFEAPKHATLLGVCLLIQTACIIEFVISLMKSAQTAQLENSGVH